MSVTNTTTVQPSFIEGVAGALFLVHHKPDESVSPRGTIIFVPPFNEEMNRSRSMVTLLARSLNAEGFGLVLVDLYGTGDSGGNYVDGNWDIWRQDIIAVADYLEKEGSNCAGILGLRLGALLAADVFSSNPERFTKLIFWQPVTNGKTHFVQFLRIRLAANLDRKTKGKETTKILRAQLIKEGSVEVAGYEVSRELADAIDSAKLSDYFDGLQNNPILWLEHRNEENQSTPTAINNTLDKCRENSVDINFMTFVGPAFWQMHERSLAPEVIERTLDWLKQA